MTIANIILSLAAAIFHAAFHNWPAVCGWLVAAIAWTILAAKEHKEK